jgi:hypothetical protein
MQKTFTPYTIEYAYGSRSIPVEVHIFDDGKKEIFVFSNDEMFKKIVHRSALFFDVANHDHWFEEIGQPPVLFSCFSDQRCANFLKGLLFSILADYNIGLRLLQVSRN